MPRRRRHPVDVALGPDCRGPGRGAAGAERARWTAELGDLLQHPARGVEVLARPDAGAQFRLFGKVVALFARPPHGSPWSWWWMTFTGQTRPRFRCSRIWPSRFRPQRVWSAPCVATHRRPADTEAHVGGGRATRPPPAHRSRPPRPIRCRRVGPPGDRPVSQSRRRPKHPGPHRRQPLVRARTREIPGRRGPPVRPGGRPGRRPVHGARHRPRPDEQTRRRGTVASSKSRP